MIRVEATVRAVLRSLVPVVCPPEAGPLATPIIEHALLTVGSMPTALQHGFTAGLMTYDLGALPRYRVRARTLTGARADAYFWRWEHSRIPPFVELARTLNRVMSMACYEQGAMADAIGFHPGAWIERVKARRLAVYKDDIRAQAEQILAPDPLRPQASGLRSQVSDEVA